MKKYIKIWFVLLLLFFPYYSKNNIHTAHAAALTNISVTLSRLKASTGTSAIFQFTTPTGVSNGQTIVFTLAGFTAPQSNFCGTGGQYHQLKFGANTINISSSCQAAGANTWGLTSAVDGSTITLTAPTSGNPIIPAGTAVTFNTDTSTNSRMETTSATPNNYTISINAAGDTGSAQISILADDQVSVNASVDEILNFSVAQSSVSFGTIVNTARWATNAGGAGSATAASTLTAGTNANGGLVIAVRSAGQGGTAGLYSAGASKRISATTPANGTGELYSFYSATVGSLTVLAGFLSGGTTALTTSDVTFANSGSNPIDDTILNIFLKAQKIDTTPAGIYTDTLTFTCTATF